MSVQIKWEISEELFDPYTEIYSPYILYKTDYGLRVSVEGVAVGYVHVDDEVIWEHDLTLNDHPYLENQTLTRKTKAPNDREESGQYVFSLYWSGLLNEPPGKYSLVFKIFVNGDLRATVNVGSSELRGIDHFYTGPTEYYDPQEEKSSKNFKVEYFALPPTWEPTSLNYSYSFYGKGFEGEGPSSSGTFTPSSSANGKIGEVNINWDGKLTNNRYAESPMIFSHGYSADIPERNRNIRGSKPHFVPIYHRRCLTDSKAREAQASASIGGNPSLPLFFGSNEATILPASMGYGWRSLSSARVDATTSGIFIYKDEFGRVHRWEDNGFGLKAYDESNHLEIQSTSSSGYRLISRNGNYREFNSLGKLVEERDIHGNGTNLIYNQNGDLSELSDTMGHTLYISYGSRTDGQMTELREDDPINGRQTVLGYNVENRLESITDPLGRITEFEYDSDGMLILKKMVYSGTDNLTNVYEYSKKPSDPAYLLSEYFEHNRLICETVDDSLMIGYHTNLNIFVDKKVIDSHRDPESEDIPDTGHNSRNMEWSTDSFGRHTETEKNKNLSQS